jgi:hypothetical protein
MTGQNFNDLENMTPAQRKVALKSWMKPYLIRLGIVLVVSIFLSVAFNELAFYFQKEAFDRQPEMITIVIPSDTAARVAQGETPPEIPGDLSFVVGDTLEVVNKDSISHQLGPLFIPAKSVARLVMENANQYTYACSFRSNEYLGITVRQPTTIGIRFTGLMLAAPTTAVLFFLYSLVLWPVKPREIPASITAGP